MTLRITAHLSYPSYIHGAKFVWATPTCNSPHQVHSKADKHLGRPRCSNRLVRLAAHVACKFSSMLLIAPPAACRFPVVELRRNASASSRIMSAAGGLKTGRLGDARTDRLDRHPHHRICVALSFALFLPCPALPCPLPFTAGCGWVSTPCPPQQAGHMHPCAGLGAPIFFFFFLCLPNTSPLRLHCSGLCSWDSRLLRSVSVA